MQGFELLLQPLVPGVPAGEDVDLEVLVRVQAPDRPEEAAPPAPLHLAVVLDRSGSMAGAPLQEAKRCALEIARRLGPQDRLAVVAYDNRVRVLWPLAAPVPFAAVAGRVAALTPGGNTDLHGGWAAGVEELRRDLDAPAVRRVLLLSDGQANAGLTDPKALSEACGRAQAEGIATSTYGLGAEFQEQVMTTLARAGQGRAYYGETAEDLLDPFLEEFDLASSLVARDVRLSLRPYPGLTVTLANPYPSLGPLSWRLPDLAWDGEAWAVLRLSGPAALLQGLAEGGGFPALAASVVWTDPAGRPGTLGPCLLTVPVVDLEAYAELPENPAAALRRTQLRAADLQEQAYRACLEDDWDLVRSLLDRMRALAQQDEALAATVEELEGLAEAEDPSRFRKEVHYQLISGLSRISGKDETGSGSREASYLRRKRRMGKGEPRVEDGA